MDTWDQVISVNESKFADVTFECIDGKIQAHKLLLAMKSPMLASMFYRSGFLMEESIPVKHAFKDHFRNLIHVVYHGEVHNSLSLFDACKVLELAAEYMLHDAQWVLLQHICLALTESLCVMQVLEFAREKNQPVLILYCIQYQILHFNHFKSIDAFYHQDPSILRVILSDNALPATEIEVFRAALRCPNLEDVIRWDLIKFEDLAGEVRASGKLSDRQILDHIHSRYNCNAIARKIQGYTLITPLLSKGLLKSTLGVWVAADDKLLAQRTFLDSDAVFSVQAKPDNHVSFLLKEKSCFIPVSYTLVDGSGSLPGQEMRNWVLEGSEDGVTFETLSSHCNDLSLGPETPKATWNIPCVRYLKTLRLRVTLPNTHFDLCLAGAEFNGFLLTK